MYLIWSYEHNAWWKPNQRGYTKNIAEAGRYTLAEAGEIVVPHIPPGEEVAVDENYVKKEMGNSFPMEKEVNVHEST
jgi:hypothetical protein